MKRALILCLALLAGASGAAEAVVDSFYENRMQSGIRAFEEGNWEQALADLESALNGALPERDRKNAHLTLAEIYASKGDNVLAEHHRQRAVAEEPAHHLVQQSSLFSP